MLDKLAKLAPRERIGLAIAGVCVLCLLVDRLAVQLVVRSLDGLRADIAAAALQRDANLRVAAQETSVRGEYDALRAMLESSASMDADINQLKGEIDDLARASGVSIVSMKHSPPTVSPFTQEYIVEIGQMETDMPALMRFLSQLGESGGMLRVVRLALSPARGTYPLKGSMAISKVMIANTEPAAEPAPGSPEA